MDNVVHVNLLALFTDSKNAINQVYNVACGEQTSLNQLWEYIQEITGVNCDANYGPARVGDVKHSLADIGKASELLDYNPRIDVKKGLGMTSIWLKFKDEKIDQPVPLQSRM